jgi:alpha-beta hydrolase superfamily lysophospholipase
MSEFAGALGPMIGVSRHYEGPMGKSDRAVVFGALGLWLGLGGPLPGWLGGLMPLIAGLLVLTIANRVRGGLAEASRLDVASAPPVAVTDRDPLLRSVEERRFRAADGTELFYRFWPAQSATPQGAVVLFHRGHEHGGRMAHLADELDLPDFAIFAWDARGHGRSRGEVGNSASLATSVRDVQDFVDHIAATYEIAAKDIAIIAQSVGAVLVAAWAHDYAPPIRCLVLASPAFKVKPYVPFARSLLKLRYALFGHFFVNSYVKARFLTHDPDRVASYEADPLITRPIAVNILLQLYEAGARIVDDARAIVVPTQLLISGADWVVQNKIKNRFYC